MKTAFATSAQEYFDRLPDERREALSHLRSMIGGIWPGALEDMTHGMPTYHLDGHAFCAIASREHFMVLYVIHYDLLDVFRNDLKVHDKGRSCIRFRRLEPGTLELFGRIVRYTGAQMAASRYFGANRRPVHDRRRRR